MITRPSNYPKRHFRRRLLTLLGWGPVLSAVTLITILGLLFSCPTMTANLFILSWIPIFYPIFNLVPKDPSLRPPLLRKEEDSCLAVPERVVARRKGLRQHTPRLATDPPRIWNSERDTPSEKDT